MNIELSKKQFRRLLDLVYIGNWILNSTRGDQRFRDYDEVESLVFSTAVLEGMPSLAELYQGEIVPSRAFVEGGIHEAIAVYEDAVGLLRVIQSAVGHFEGHAAGGHEQLLDFKHALLLTAPANTRCRP